MELLLLTATARKEKRISTVENAHAKKLDKSMRLCERKVGLTSPGIQGKNLVETDPWRCPLESVEKGKPAIHKAVIKTRTIQR